jgi:hypothetical protein
MDQFSGSRSTPRKGKSRTTLQEQDFAVARRALTRNWPDLAQSSPKYAAFLELLADFHRQFGGEDFELRYNLRPPKDRVEAWTQQFMHGALNEAEYAACLKSDAERPIDLEMLTAVCDGYEKNLAHYSGILQGVIPKSGSRESASDRGKQERSIDRHAAALAGKTSIWRENLETVFEFLEENRVGSGRGLVTLGEFEGTSAHWLAQLVFTRTAQAWQSCKEIAFRSRTDARYLYSARASELFSKSWLPILPSPQSLHERMREEYVLARMALKHTSAAAIDKSAAIAAAAENSAALAIDNESRELVLVGLVTAIVGNAGHIFRPLSNSDWGIDGEIEFKDDAGNANGQRLYLQLKSGDSYLTYRQRDGAEVFRIANARHAQYWQQHAYPVMLVIRSSDGSIRWMGVSAYLRTKGETRHEPVREIIFEGEPFNSANVHKWRDKPATSL